MIEKAPLKHRGIPWIESEINETLKMYNEGLSIEKISEIIGRSISSIQHKIKTFEAANRRNDWTKEEESRVIFLRNKGMEFKQIAKLLNRTDRSVQSKHIRITTPQKPPTFIRKEAIDNYRRVYTVNDNYFSNIDSQKKAFYLGFIMADGYVLSGINAKRGKTILNSLGIHIAIKDLDFLEEFKKDIKSNAPIIKKDPKTSIYKGREIKGTESITLRISSEQMIKDLRDYGVTQNKTYICSFPNKLERKYYSGFIAGLISGDGYVGVRTNHIRYKSSLRSSLAGTKELISRVRDILIEEIGFNPNKPIYDIKASKCLFTVELNQSETLSMYNWMKDNGIFLMSRKNKIIEDFILQSESA